VDRNWGHYTNCEFLGKHLIGWRRAVSRFKRIEASKRVDIPLIALLIVVGRQAPKAETDGKYAETLVLLRVC